MKVNIGPYINHIGPFQLAEKIMFWKEKDHSNENCPVWKLGDRLSEYEWLTSLLNWLDKKKKRKIVIRIDNYDVWSMDNTLAMIIVPMLKTLKENKHGAPYVDDSDVPLHLRSICSAPLLTEVERENGTTDSNYFERWDYVLDEMIWAFEQHANPDWEDQFYSGKSDVKIQDGELIIGPNDTFKVDKTSKKQHEERMENGRRLFAKYYQCLWD